jgi:hypothetical protein
VARFTHPAIESSSAPNLYYGSFFSTEHQEALANTPTPMTFNNTDLSNGVTIVDNSKITIANSGIYNIQFSAQLYKHTGGSSSAEVNAWLRKNNNNVASTDTRWNVENDFQYVVAIVNFFVDASAGDYYQLMWMTSSTQADLHYEAASVNHPAIPSIILTVNQVG